MAIATLGQRIGAGEKSKVLLLKNILIGLFALLSATANADPITFRIGTGGSAGTYFPIGTLLSQSITHANLQFDSEANSRSHVIAVAQRSNGSVANVTDIENGLLEGALSQADVVHWAYHASGPFADSEPKTSLRTVASLYPESIHLVARADSGIKTIQDLIGRSVSIDVFGSGTLFDVRLVLSAFDIELDDINPVYLKLNDSIDRLRKNQLDAFIVVAGYPIKQISDLVNEGKASIIAIEGPNVTELMNDYSFFSVDTMPAATYQNEQAINTLAVSAQFIVSAHLDKELVYQISKTLWSNRSTQLLKNGHPKGKAISMENAVVGVSIPLHPGAKKFYDEQSIDTSSTPAP